MSNSKQNPSVKNGKYVKKSKMENSAKSWEFMKEGNEKSYDFYVCC